ncbi:hypothetical protein CDL15_Pgr009199 [Punica granatum]|uniref:Uncharacterized protein n=1 Tax=Punica granatum TaxID=22663 RepID=A0A218WUW8_PUNGR|nr:hypothetical protein CDL15_Pgr009199 [Punica granatum]
MMVQDNQPTIFEENTPPTLVYSQQPATHAPPPLTSVGVPLAHHEASSMAQVSVPLPVAQALSASTDDVARITTLEGGITTLRGTVNQMVADMAELMGPNRASSNSTLPQRYGPTVDLNP